MKRTPRQAVLPFGRKERAINRAIAERMNKRGRRGGETLPRRTLGRPPTGTDAMPHTKRAPLKEASAVHVTLGLTKNAPNLRSRKKFALVKRSLMARKELPGFRVVHFAVLGDHIHAICEADSAECLAKAIQKICISVARLLNLDGVREAGGSLERTGIPLRERPGWIGRIFQDRYYVHHLASPTEMANALRYIYNNALQHFGRIDGMQFPIRKQNGTETHVTIDVFTSFAHQYAFTNPWKPTARGFLLNRAMRQQRFT